MDKKNKGLGKGLGSLIKDKSMAEKILSEARPDEEVIDVELSKIKTNPKQPRKIFDEEQIKELADSIKQNGLIQPIILRPVGTFYEIIAGERRFRAVKSLGEDKISAIIREMDDEKSAKVSLIENLQRVDLNPIDEARAYENIMADYNLTQALLAEVVGKSRPYIANIVRLLKLDERVIRMIEEGRLTLSHGKALLSIEKGEQYKAAIKLINTKASVRKAEKYKRPDDPYKTGIEEKLIEKFSTKVSISGNRMKGTINLTYYSGDELERLIELLLGRE